MRRKKWFFLAGIMFMLFLGLALGVFLNKPSPSPTPFPSPGFTTELPKIISPQQDTLLEDDKDFKIIYSPSSSHYDILIYGSPFADIRIKAEAAFLKKQNNSLEEACRLSVSIITPEFANPKEAAREYPLSFCISPSPT